MSATPSSLRIGKVVLTVHDLGAVSDFYQKALGLHRLSADGETVRLGAGGAVLLELRQDKAARRRVPREAGLFHTAFLLPSRGDLGRWTRHAAATGVPVSGASDHLVSEAIYLDDPEDNGVEIYADRPRSEWGWQDGRVQMSTAALDVDSLVASGGGEAWKGFPDGATVGHVHLQVGALDPAEAFYAGTLGLEVTCRYPGATFYAADGYHHHIAANIWNSRGAAVRTPSTGLSEVEILATPEAAAAIAARAGGSSSGETRTLLDPWGTPITFAA